MKTLDAKTKVSLKNILFATDFSMAANAALPYALGLARRYGSKVYGVHARDPVRYVMVTPEAWPALAESVKKEEQEETARLESQLGGVPHEVVIVEGGAWEVISRLIEKNEIELVVIGTRGRTGLGKVLLGSVAEQIFRQATCPVLTVGPRTSEDAERLLEMKEVLYATDFTPQSLAAAPYAISLAQEHQARLTLLHVLEEPKVSDPFFPKPDVIGTARRLQDLVPPEAELWIKPDFLVEHGVPAEQILEVAARRRADLIVLGVRQTGSHLGIATHLARPTIHRVVVQALCPVLTVRE